MDLREKELMHKISRKQCAGFTFLEVTIALAILASALTILLGLQSAVIERTVLQRQQREAMTFAREIMSAVEARESAGNPLDIGNYEGSPNEILANLLPGSERPSGTVDDAPSSILSHQVILQVDYWGIPKISERAMKRVELRITWGKRAPETLQFVLFIPFDEDEVTESEDNDDAS